MSTPEQPRDTARVISDLQRQVAALQRRASGVPYQSHALRVVTADERSTTATTYTSVFTSTFPRYTAGLAVVVQVRSSAAGTTGDVVVTDGAGVALPLLGGGAQPPLVIDGSTALVTLTTPTLAVPAGLRGDLVTVYVRIRRTAGAGTVYVTPVTTLGVPG